MAALKISSSIKTILSLRFGILIAIFTVSVFYTFFTLNKSIYINTEINEVYNPSVKKTQELKLLINNSKQLIANWVFVQSDNNNADKVKLKELIFQQYPAAKEDLKKTAQKWPLKERQLLDSTLNKITLLFNDYKKVMNSLSTFESYNDPLVVFEISPIMVEQGGISIKYNNIITDLDKISKIQASNAEEASSNMSHLLKQFKYIMLVIAIVTIILGIITTVNTVNMLIKPINHVKNALSKMGRGELSEEKLEVTKDEMGEMSAALNYLSDGLRGTAAYADKIGNGDFNATFTPLSENDLLGNALLEMGKKLKALSEEDKKRNWVTAGLAKFADILRANNDLTKLADETLSNLVKYLNANQGGIFLVQKYQGERVLEQLSCYAYERKKFIQKTIREGEGLLGQCLLEKDTIYLTEIPEGYISITSGIGSSNPNCIIIQPLVVNEEMVGVIELASFKVFDKFELEFIKKLSENIAGVISTVKINERTVKLLEEARTAQEAMRSQEEELRQNLEELTATQEEMFRKEQEYLERIASLEGKRAQVA